MLLPNIEMKNKNGTKQGGLDSLLGMMKTERLTDEDMLFVTVGIVSKHMYIHVQQQVQTPAKCA